MFTKYFQEPGPDNIAWGWVSTVIPDNLDSPWGKSVAVFSAFFVWMAAFFLMFQALKLIAVAASRGETTALKGAWMPIRIFLGFGLLVPVAANFSSIHIGIRNVFLLPAVNIADDIWLTYVSHATSTPIVPKIDRGNDVILALAQSTLCKTVDDAINENSTGWFNRKKAWPQPEAVVGGYTQWHFGNGCGVFKLEMLTADSQNRINQQRIQLISHIISTFKEKFEPFKQYIGKSNTGFNDETLNMAETLTRGGPFHDLLEKYHQLAGDFNDVNNQIVQSFYANDNIAAQTHNSLIEGAQKFGFIYMPQHFPVVSAMSQRLVKTATVDFEYSAPTLPKEGKIPDSLQKNYAEFSGVLASILKFSHLNSNISANDFTAIQDNDSDTITKVLAPMTRGFSELMLAQKYDENLSFMQNVQKRDPFSETTASGHIFINLVYSVITATAIVMAGASSIVGAVVGGVGVVLLLVPIVLSVVFPVLMIGITRAFILPIMPFIFCFIAFTNYLVRIVEAVIGAVAWCITFISTDDKEAMAQKSNEGWYLIFQLLLTPALIVLSFVSIFFVHKIAVGTLTMMWSQAFFSINGGHVSGLLTYIIGYVIITYLEVIVTYTLLNTAIDIPDRILSYLGANGHIANNSTINSGLQAGTNAAASGVGAAAGAMIGSAKSGTSNTNVGSKDFNIENNINTPSSKKIR